MTIGGVIAPLTEVTATRIKGQLPPASGTPDEPVDVVRDRRCRQRHLPRRLPVPARNRARAGPLGSSTRCARGPGEVAAGVVDGKLYVVGRGRRRDLRLRPHERSVVAQGQGTTVPRSPSRRRGDRRPPLPRGGLGSRVGWQVADLRPDRERLESRCRLAVGRGIALDCGHRRQDLRRGRDRGKAARSTTRPCTTRSRISGRRSPPMPAGRNHAAFNTNGQKLFVFGGREGGNVVGNGFDDVQVYDPATNTWEASFQAGSSLEPLPVGRGGMGRAVFWRGEFYVFGGETLNGPGALPGSRVYDRVDVYDPKRNTWRADRRMLNPRHGIYPRALPVAQSSCRVAGWLQGTRKPRSSTSSVVCRSARAPTFAEVATAGRDPPEARSRQLAGSKCFPECVLLEGALGARPRIARKGPMRPNFRVGWDL